MTTTATPNARLNESMAFAKQWDAFSKSTEIDRRKLSLLLGMLEDYQPLSDSDFNRIAEDIATHEQRITDQFRKLFTPQTRCKDGR